MQSLYQEWFKEPWRGSLAAATQPERFHSGQSSCLSLALLHGRHRSQRLPHRWGFAD